MFSSKEVISRKRFSETGTYEQIDHAGSDPKNFDGKASKRFLGSYLGNGGWSMPSFPSFSSLPSLPDIGNSHKMKRLEAEVEDLEAKNDLMKNEIVSVWRLEWHISWQENRKEEFT